MTFITMTLISIAIVGGMLLLGLATAWIDRKVTARVQARVGPPWYQPAADIIKLMGKETLIPAGPGRTVFLLSPVAGFAGILAASLLLGWVLIAPSRGFFGDIIALVYLLVVPSGAMILGASASGNIMSTVGASREMKLILGYELPYLIVIAAVIARTGFDLRLGSIIAAQQSGGWFLWSISGVIAFAVLVLTTQAKLGLVPFDVPEADQELMGGIITEYSGPPLAVIRLTKTMLLAVMPLFTVLLLMGGFGTGGLGIVWGMIGYIVIIVLVTLIRNTNPRVRIDQALRFFWGPVTILSVIGFVAAVYGW